MTVIRCGLHSHPSPSLPFTYYPAMPGNSTFAAADKWEVQRPRMAALMGQAAADRCFQSASRWGMDFEMLGLRLHGAATGGPDDMPSAVVACALMATRCAAACAVVERCRVECSVTTLADFVAERCLDRIDLLKVMGCCRSCPACTSAPLLLREG